MDSRESLSRNQRNIRHTTHVSLYCKKNTAHVCICFVAYKVYKELERVLKTNGISLSVDKVLAIAKTITTIKVNMPHNDTTYTKTMLITNKHKLIAKLFDDDFWVTQ
jgi:predicted SpoU family rRNA methylase